MRIDPDTTRDPELLAREVRRLQALLDEIREAADQADVEYREEIARLRLTEAERSAIRDAADRYASITPESAETAATLRGLLDRTGH